MEKRVVLALALSLSLVLGYQFLIHKMYPDAYRKKIEAAGSKSESKTTSAATSSEAAANFTAPTTPQLTAPESFSSKEDVAFQNDFLSMAVNKKGAGIRELSFKKFRDSETDNPLQVIDFSKPEGLPTSIFVELVTPISKSVLSDYTVTTAGRSIDAVAQVEGLLITKHYDFSKGRYDATVTVRIQNVDKSPKQIRYQIFTGPSFPARHAIDGQYIEANFYGTENSKKVLKHHRESREGKSIQSTGVIEWVATKDRHFSIILKPNSGEFVGRVEGLGQHHFRASLVSRLHDLSPGEVLEDKFLFYAGPNDLAELEPLGLGEIINFGKLNGIAKVLVGMLEMIHGIVKNYGVAIIILTLIINVILFPFTRASYMSMKRMQQLQPQMSKLREQHKNNPEKLNRETMELYRKNKVNPFGGCLPMLIQMPVFLALYVALSKVTILINSKILWIKDLSSPDSVPLPFTLPFLGDKIHVLPIVMLVAMVLQQRMTQVPLKDQDPAIAQQQKMMMIMMPILFGFIFYNMPSGLVLYWLTNTLFTFAYQYRLKKMTI